MEITPGARNRSKLGPRDNRNFHCWRFFPDTWLGKKIRWWLFMVLSMGTHTHRQTHYIYICIYAYTYIGTVLWGSTNKHGILLRQRLKSGELKQTNPPQKNDKIIGPFPRAVECHVLLQLGIAMSKCHLGPSNVTGIKVQEHSWNVARHQPRCGRGAACEGKRQMDAHNIVTW